MFLEFREAGYAKSEVLGCGETDADADGDGIPDPDDECPNDPETTLSGICGCPSAPTAAGTRCDDGFVFGRFECDGKGFCGNPTDSPLCAGAEVCKPFQWDKTLFWVVSGGAGNVTWSEAVERCIGIPDVSGELVRVHNEAENMMLARIIPGTTWMNANDIDSEGVWRWRADAITIGSQIWEGDENGTPSGGYYTNWAEGQPSGGEDENCSALLGDGDRLGQWDDLSCDDIKLPFICETRHPKNRIPPP